MQKVRNYIILTGFLVGWTFISLLAADLPRHPSYYRLYQLMDELASYGLVDLNSAVKPYGSRWMQQQLVAISTNTSKLQLIPLRLRREVVFQLEEFAPEGGRSVPGILTTCTCSGRSISTKCNDVVSFRIVPTEILFRTN